MDRLFTRREMLRAGVAGLLGSALAGFGKAEAHPAADFHFVVANDIHYVSDECGRWLERVIAKIRALPERPAFCVLAGDLSEHGERTELASVRAIFNALPMPVFNVIGNHDWRTPRMCDGFDAIFPRCRNYVFDACGWQFVCIDSTRGQRVFLSVVPEHTLNWLDATLPRLDRRKPTVVFTHFPLGPNFLRPVNADEVLERFARHDLREVFSGHWHGQSFRQEENVGLSTGRCCSRWRKNHDGSPAKGFVACSVRAGVVSRRFVEVPVSPGESAAQS